MWHGTGAKESGICRDLEAVMTIASPRSFFTERDSMSVQVHPFQCARKNFDRQPAEENESLYSPESEPQIGSIASPHEHLPKTS